MEDRFLANQDKDFLLMILDSMKKGHKVEVKKIKQIYEAPVASITASNLSMQDKNNILQIFEMFGGEHNRNLIEKIYIQNSKNMEVTLDIFLTGNIPKENEELHVIIDQKIDMPISQIHT